MNYRKVFPTGKQLFVVVHVESPDQAMQNVATAKENGADGVFLIGHRISHKELTCCYCYVRDRVPDFFVGLNYLDLDNRQSIRLVSQLQTEAVWLDDPTPIVQLRGWQQEMAAERLIVFGGVAFKGQRAVTDPAQAAREAAPYLDVVTTSGDRTGLAPTVEKIQEMKKAIGDVPLAIASGITSDNVAAYLAVGTDCFLVATGISFSFAALDPAKVGALSKIIHNSTS